jgi:hypothetical protein
MPAEKLRASTSYYHMGHAIAPMAAPERALFREEGFDGFELLLEGVPPAFVEKEALFARERNLRPNRRG